MRQESDSGLELYTFERTLLQELIIHAGGMSCEHHNMEMAIVPLL